MLLLYGGKYSWTQSLEKTDMRWQYHYFHISVQYCFLFVIVYYWGGEVSLKTIFNHISHHFMVAGVQEDWDDVTKYTNLLSQCIPLSLIKFQILDPFSSVPIQIMRYFRHFDSLFFAPLWDLPAPIGNKSGSRDKIADQSRVGHVIQNSAQSQASTRMSWAWTTLAIAPAASKPMGPPLVWRKTSSPIMNVWFDMSVWQCVMSRNHFRKQTYKNNSCFFKRLCKCEKNLFLM